PRALFRGPPPRLRLGRVFPEGFDVPPLRAGGALGAGNADAVYDAIAERLAKPDFRPRALVARSTIEGLATPESPLDPLAAHARLAADGWAGRVVTTFRPDDLVDMEWPGWAGRVAALGELTGEDTATHPGGLAALRSRRAAFIAAGATSSDHGHPTAATLALSPGEAVALYERGLRGAADAADA